MAYQLFRLPKAVGLDSAVRALSGAKAYFYETGTTTPQDTYSDSDLTTPHAHPVVADSSGVFPPIYLDPSRQYKLTLNNSADELIYTVDPVNDRHGVSYDRTAAEIAAGVTPVDYSGASRPWTDAALRYGLVGDGTTDNTDAFTRMCSVAGQALFIKRGDYVTSSFSLPDNTTLYLEPGTVIRDSGALGNSVRLMNIVGVSNIHIIGWGAKILMDRNDYTSGEQRHGVNIREATNVTIEGLESSDCGGDGFYVGGDAAPSVNVTLIGCRGDNNRRQGLSVVNVRHFRDIDGVWTNTTGTAPSAGIDIEPNNATDTLEDVKIIRPRCVGNDGAGIMVFLGNWHASTNYADIDIIDPYTEDNGSGVTAGGITLRRVSPTNPPKGRIRIIRGKIVDEYHCGIEVKDWDEGGPRVDIIEPTIINPNAGGGTSTTTDGGILLYSDSDPTTTPGNVNIYRPSIQDDDDNLGSNSLNAIYVSGVGGGWGKVRIYDPEIRWSGNSPWFINNNSRDVRVFADVPGVVSLNTDLTITDGRYLGRVITNGAATGTIEVTLPEATATIVGRRFMFEVAAAHQMRIKPNGTDLIRGGTGGQLLASSTIGDNVTIECDGAGTWKIVSLYGTWSFL